MHPARILVIGSGGREHALAWRLARDPHAPHVELAPGHDGAAREFPVHAVGELDAAALAALCAERAYDLVVIGPEAPLAAGVSDHLARAGVLVFGPSREAARLEASKWFAKQVMLAARVPTGRAERHEDAASARQALRRFAPPWVIKADGLAAGKGVRVTDSEAEASAFVGECLEQDRFGEGGRALVIEEHLRGEEVSVMAVCDGEDAVLLPPARDYKRALEGDLGPNTGGMGAYAPAASLDAAAEADVRERIVRPVLRELAARGTPYRGVLYCGLMLTADGPQVIEFNARFGDPETQSILPLVGGSLSTLLASAARGRLAPDSVSRRAGAAVTVALVAEGYPDAPRAGGRLEGLDEAARAADVQVFHAGTRWDGGWVVRGGRAAYLTAVADDLAAARARVMRARAGVGGTLWRSRGDIAASVQPSEAAGRRGA